MYVLIYNIKDNKYLLLNRLSKLKINILVKFDFQSTFDSLDELLNLLNKNKKNTSQYWSPGDNSYWSPKIIDLKAFEYWRIIIAAKSIPSLIKKINNEREYVNTYTRFLRNMYTL